MQIETDLEVYRRACEGDAAAVELLYRRHKDGIYAYLRGLTGHRESAEELLQEVFVGFLRERPSFQGDAALKSWLYTTARNKALNELRRRPARPLAEQWLEPREARDAATDGELRRRIQAVLESLPPEQKEVVLLKHFQDLTFAEIAAVVGAPPDTVASRHRYAMRKLEAGLQEFGR